ncbi:MAG: hypothetical protein SF028_01230 [Candidatus Sumerlaeia bacterium]|nr:hypothetical protein [Candidatus Sumerlaeia bacterium]
MSDKPRVVQCRVVKRGEAEKEFDRRFWREAGVEGRWEAAWQMLDEVYLMRGQEPVEHRLQRSVVRVFKRSR